MLGRPADQRRPRRSVYRGRASTASACGRPLTQRRSRLSNGGLDVPDGIARNHVRFCATPGLPRLESRAAGEPEMSGAVVGPACARPRRKWT